MSEASGSPAYPHLDLATLTDLSERMRRAISNLEELVVENRGTARDRIVAKAEGVRLALSYVEEAIRAAK